jgi:hypothetical protein
VGGFTRNLFDIQITARESLEDSYDPAVVVQLGQLPTAGTAPGRPLIYGEFGDPTLAPAVWTEVTYASLSQERATMVWSWETYTGGTSEVHFDQVTFDIPGYDADIDYAQAGYTAPDGTYKYFSYKTGLGTYPTLDVIAAEPEEGGSGNFFPFIHFRHDKASLGADKTSAIYKASRKMARYVGMNYDDMLGAIHENPDIDDVAQAFTMLAVPATSTVPIENRYLFEFFDDMYFGSLDDEDLDSSVLYGALHTLMIQDTLVKMSIGHGGIQKVEVVGSIGPVGTCASVWEHTPGPSWHAPTMHRYRKQISETTYQEIQVTSMEVRYHVEGNYYTTGNEDDLIFLIPLDHTITDLFSIKEREQIYARSLHLVCNSLVIVKVKWYQQEWFSDFVEFVGYAFAIWTLGTSTALSAAVQAAAYWTVVQIIVTQIVINLVIGYALALFVKLVGVDIAFFAALVAALYGAYSLSTAENFQAAIPFAGDLVKLASGVTKAAMAEMFTDLQKEYLDFKDLVTKASEDLAGAQKLLEDGSHLIEPITIFGESPENYFNRTAHSGNIGAVGFDMLHNFVDMKLSLPNFSQTLGGLDGQLV